MAFEWDESLATGNGQIDAQHQELLKRYNLFLNACKEGRGREEILKTLLFLDDYIVDHFRTEEAMQLQSNFPEYSVHKVQHENFIAKTAELVSQFREGGASIDLLVKTNTTLMDWFVSHIRKMDRTLARHLREARE